MIIGQGTIVTSGGMLNVDELLRHLNLLPEKIESKFIAIYDGKANTRPEMSVPEIFANQKQYDTIQEVRLKRAGSGRVIAILQMIYKNGCLIDTKLHYN